MSEDLIYVPGERGVSIFLGTSLEELPPLLGPARLTASAFGRGVRVKAAIRFDYEEMPYLAMLGTFPSLEGVRFCSVSSSEVQGVSPFSAKGQAIETIPRPASSHPLVVCARETKSIAIYDPVAETELAVLDAASQVNAILHVPFWDPSAVFYGGHQYGSRHEGDLFHGDATTGAVLTVFKGHGGPTWGGLYGISCDLSRHLLFTCSSDSTARIWSPRLPPSEACVETFSLSASAFALYYSSDQNLLMVATRGGDFEVFDIRQSPPFSSLGTHNFISNQVSSLDRITPHEPYFVACSKDSLTTFSLYDSTSDPLRILSRHSIDGLDPTAISGASSYLNVYCWRRGIGGKESEEEYLFGIDTELEEGEIDERMEFVERLVEGSYGDSGDGFGIGVQIGFEGLVVWKVLWTCLIVS